MISDQAIRRLFFTILVLFALLVAFTSRWTVFEADSLRDNTANRRPLLEQRFVDRGDIRAADGTVLAHSVKRRDGVYLRRYPLAGALFAHAVGYSYTSIGRAGLERSHNQELAGQRIRLRSLLDRLTQKRPVGEDLVTTLDTRAQRVATQALAGRAGAVVAIEPQTGKVRVMASVPGFNPAALGNRAEYSQLQQDSSSPLYNRATQSSYPPGSTFKLVTAAAALDSGEFTPNSMLNGDSGQKVSGVPLANFQSKDFGRISLTTALTNSVNTVWARVAERLGKATMNSYMERFGFRKRPPLDYPASQLAVSGEFRKGKLLATTSDAVDVGRMGIGQDKLQVTPLQMAMVVSAIANDGLLMKPTFLERVVDHDGRTVDKPDPQEAGRVMSTEAASQLNQMMRQVVSEGTGVAAALSGVDVAGKTGTAERNPQTDLNQPWFVGFAPAGRPRIAVAVTVESSISGEGGTVAAPIAKQVMEVLLR